MTLSISKENELALLVAVPGISCISYYNMHQSHLTVSNIHSAIQSLPYLAQNASRLITYQRSSPWILPRPQIVYPEFVKWLFRNIPLVMLLHRWFLYMVVRKTILYKNTQFIYVFDNFVQCRAKLFTLLLDIPIHSSRENSLNSNLIKVQVN